MAIVHDLGHGVSVTARHDGTWTVLARDLGLPWAERIGRHPGTAVMWRDEAYQVVQRFVVAGQTSWSLEPWPVTEAMRSVFRLDERSVASLAAGERSRRHGTRLRWLSLPVTPLLALVPGEMQLRWRSAWGFPAFAATLVSAVCELAIGTVGLLQALTAGFGGAWFLTGPARWLVIIGPVLMVEGAIRIHASMAASQPMGSVIGLPLTLLGGRPPESASLVEPRIRDFDDRRRTLEVGSPIQRSDWRAEGLLYHRGRAFGLESMTRRGDEWCYRFRQRHETDGRPSLRLAPPRPSASTDVVAAPPVLHTALTTVLVTLASRTLQERWARWLDIRPAWLTVVGAASELAGGLVNLARAQPDEPRFWLVVHLFLVLEGMARIGGLAVTSRPMGSLIGWLVYPVTIRLIARAERSADTGGLSTSHGSGEV